MLLAFLLAIAGTDPGPQHHGFFLRLDLGLGYYSSQAAPGSYTGAGAGLGISVGGNVAENLALYGSLFDAVCPQPTVTVGGTSSSPPDTTAGVAGLGMGMTYYLMPANVFLSGTAGFGRFIVTRNGSTFSTDIGLVARLGVGKEWFVSRSWGLGVAAYLNVASNKDQGADARWTTLSPLLAFSATFY